MRLPFIRAIALALVVSSLPLSASNWLLTVVPQTEEKGSQILSISSPFRVILSNATNHNLVVYKDWCSWGCFNLSFEFKGKDGKIIKVEKTQKTHWTRNFPDEFVVLPGCAYTFAVDLTGSKSEWTNVEALHGTMTMRAIYKNSNAAPDSAQKQLKPVWVGQVKSQPIQVTIAR